MPATPRPASRPNLGSCVLLPDPVSPATTITWWSRIAAIRSSRRVVMGSDSGYASGRAPTMRSSVSRRAVAALARTDACSAARSASRAERRGRRDGALMTVVIEQSRAPCRPRPARFRGGWLRTRGRQTGGVPDEVDERLLAGAPDAAGLLDAERTERYLAHGRRLITRTNWEAARGFEITDGIVATVAAHAALLVAGFEPRTDPFRDVTSVIVHAGTFVTREAVPGPVS